jgi:FliI/YscN family ATPase
VVIVAISDQAALLRAKAALVATAIAEYFRDLGKNVIFIMDSITRYAMALREIGLAIGEPPTTRGYTPSVFSTLPKLLERTGNAEHGSITGFYSILTEGDDLNDPIADAVRAILDGHIILSRKLANGNHFPAIDVLASLSRVMSDVVSKEHWSLSGSTRDFLQSYREAEDIINIGAYIKGSNSRIDRAMTLYPALTQFLKQSTNESFTLPDTLKQLSAIID